MITDFPLMFGLCDIIIFVHIQVLIVAQLILKPTKTGAKLIIPSNVELVFVYIQYCTSYNKY